MSFGHGVWNIEGGGIKQGGGWTICDCCKHTFPEAEVVPVMIKLGYIGNACLGCKEKLHLIDIDGENFREKGAPKMKSRKPGRYTLRATEAEWTRLVKEYPWLLERLITNT